MHELGFEEYPFTWSNRRLEEANIQCRLDRAITIMGYIEQFSLIRVFHFPRFRYDHVFIRVYMDVIMECKNPRPNYLFRFEEVFTKDTHCEDSVRQCWINGGSGRLQKLKVIQGLSDIFKDYRLGMVNNELGRIEQRLEEFGTWAIYGENILAYKALENQRDTIQKTEEIIWR